MDVNELIFNSPHFEIGNRRLKHLVEDVVTAFDFLLLGDTRLLKEVRLDVTSGEFALKAHPWDRWIGKPTWVLKCIRMNLPKRDELSFREVLAFPYDSRIGFVATIWEGLCTYKWIKDSYLIFQWNFFLCLPPRRGHHREIGNHLFFGTFK